MTRRCGARLVVGLALALCAAACGPRYDILADARTVAADGDAVVALALYRQGFASSSPTPSDRVMFAALLYDEARAAFDDGDTGRGLALIDELARIDAPAPVLAAARVRAADAMEAVLAPPSDVAAMLQAAYDGDPASVAASDLAAAWELAGDRERAAEALRAAWVAEPNDPAIALAWGQAASRAGRHEEAIEALAGAADARPDDVTTAISLAMAQERAQQLPAAEQTWQALLNGHPTQPAVWQARAGFLTRQGRHDEASAARRRAAELSPSPSR